jgi:hypothetical protein
MSKKRLMRSAKRSKDHDSGGDRRISDSFFFRVVMLLRHHSASGTARSDDCRSSVPFRSCGSRGRLCGVGTEMPSDWKREHHGHASVPAIIQSRVMKEMQTPPTLAEDNNAILTHIASRCRVHATAKTKERRTLPGTPPSAAIDPVTEERRERFQ